VGFSLEMFTEHPASNVMARNEDTNGVFLLKPNEQKTLTVDLQHTNTLVGDISIQGVSSHDLELDFYYSNWVGPIDPKYGFDALLDPFNIQSKDHGKTLWFQHDKHFSLIANTPKHEQITFPICRFIRVVVNNPHEEDVIIALHCLFV